MKDKINTAKDITTRISKGLFSSYSEEWETPQYVFDWIDNQFHFVLDVCATAKNAKCKKYYTKTEDGLKQKWFLDSEGGACFMNPPYGKKIFRWMCKAKEEGDFVTVVCLIPARTDTKWFHDYVMRADEVWFIRGRLKFGNSKQSAPFPSCITIFRPPDKKINIRDSPLVKSIKIENKCPELFQKNKETNICN